MKKYLLLSLLLVSSILITNNAFAADSGDVITCPGSSSVYYLGSSLERWVFPDSKTYYSWYANLDVVITVDCNELAKYKIAGNITIQPGTWLIKSQSSPKIYAVEPGGVLRWIRSENDAEKIYGKLWQNRIHELPDTQWLNYTIGAPLVNGEMPKGNIVFALNRPGTVESEFYYYANDLYQITDRIDEVLNDNPSKTASIQNSRVLNMTDDFWSQIKNPTWNR